MAAPPELSLQLYSLKEQSLTDPAEMLSMVEGLGYAAVETAGDYGWGLEEWRKQLDKNRLRLSGAHLLMERLEAEMGQLADFNQQLGNRHLIVPVPPDGDGADRYHRCAERLNQVAAEAVTQGCHLSYHNHHWEFEPLDDECELVGMDILLAETDPNLVKFQVDTAWAIAGGGDVLKLLKTFRDRVRCLHVKEYGTEKKNEPAMGTGDVPFLQILPMAVEDGWELTVEHEPGGAAPEGVRVSANYLREQLTRIEVVR